jgi:hypothetical protein
MAHKRRQESAKMEPDTSQTCEILIALNNANLERRLNEAFDGHIEIIPSAGLAVQKHKNGYRAVVLDYTLDDNAVKAAIQMGKMPDNVKLIGYRWEIPFASLTDHNAVSDRRLAYCIARYAGMDESAAKSVAGTFDDKDLTVKDDKKCQKE